MIEMNYGQVTDFNFVRGVQKLTNSPLRVTTSIKVKRIVEELNKQRKKISDEYQNEIVLAFAEKDEKGEVLRKDPTQPMAFDVPDDLKEKFQAAEEAFGKRIFQIDRIKIKVDAIDHVQLTVAELSAIEPLLDLAE